MASRAIRAALNNPASWIELPTLDHPQYVDQEGYELEEPYVQGEVADAGDEGGEGGMEEGEEEGGLEEVEEVDGDALQEEEEDVEMEDAEEDAVEDEAADGEGLGEGEEAEEAEEFEEEEGEREPLLDVGESLVLPYSLTQTRLHHLAHLLPHIFSHPPIPSHSKPRARGPPKSTFLFPTPPPLVQPLPLPEYHGPRKPLDTPESPGHGVDTPDGGDGSGRKVPPPSSPATATTTSKEKGKGKGKSSSSKKSDEDVPAHEIDCIARVTLSVGPISFPGTELWVGRFVEPRAGPTRVARVRPKEKDKGEQSGTKRERPKVPKSERAEKREKRRSMAEDAAMRRARMSAAQTGSPGAVRSPGPPGSYGPPGPGAAGPSARPPPRPPMGPALPPGMRPPAPAPAARPHNIPPALIQRVNLAATRHPWLSIIIHKAARASASKEELAKLARVVQRLGRGEDVGEGPEEGITKPLVNPPTQAANSTASAASGTARPPTASVASAGPSAAAPKPPPAQATPQTKSTAPAESQTSEPPVTAAKSTEPASTPATSTPSQEGGSAAATQSTLGKDKEEPARPDKEAEDDSSDEEVDMKGPPQVGGGPGPEPTTPTAAPTVPTVPTATTTVGSSLEPEPDVTMDDPSEPSSPVSTASTPLSAAPSPTPFSEPVSASVEGTANAATSTGAAAAIVNTTVVPPLPASVAASVPQSLATASTTMTTAASVPLAATPLPQIPRITPAVPSSPAVRPPSAQPSTPLDPLASQGAPLVRPPPGQPPTSMGSPAVRPSASVPLTAAPMTPVTPPLPPPPPRPKYPLLPRFLLVAFKEAQTEKLLIPLGAGSFVSRVGGDYVTGPPPPPPRLPAPVEPPKPEPVAEIPIAPIATPMEPAAGVQPNGDSKARGRLTRQSLGRSAKEAPPPPPPEPAPEPEPVVVEAHEAKPKLPPSSGLPPLPGGAPAPGTVLISTFVPAKDWIKLDWAEVEKGLPWVNPALMRTRPIEVKQESVKPLAPDSKPPKSPSRPLRQARSESKGQAHGPSEQPKAKRRHHPSMLNIAALDFLPTEGGLYPVTIRLGEVNDETWRKIKVVMEEVAMAEMRDLVQDEPELMKDVMPPPPPAVPVPQPSSTTHTPTVTPLPPAMVHLAASGAKSPPLDALASAPPTGNGLPQTPVPSSVTPTSAALPPSTSPATAVPPASMPAIPVPRPSAPLHPLAVPAARDVLRATLRSRKKSHFTSLLSRVPLRSFLRFRTEAVDPALVEATTDKWAPRPYPMSTKPLYTRSPPPEDEEAVPVALSPERPVKRKKNEVEETVTFEMPVSLDALDERVEEGARTVLGKKRGRGGKVPVDDGRKRYGKRWKAGTTCEGCGRSDLRVWRRGPNGKATLCNPCGDKYLAGELGELVAPGAASGNAEEEGAEGEGGAEREGEEEVEQPEGGKEGSQLQDETIADIKVEGGEEAGIVAGTSDSATVSKPGEAEEPIASVSDPAPAAKVHVAEPDSETAVSPTLPAPVAQQQDDEVQPSGTTLAKDIAPRAAETTVQTSVEEQSAPSADAPEDTAMEVD